MFPQPIGPLQVDAQWISQIAVIAGGAGITPCLLAAFSKVPTRRREQHFLVVSKRMRMRCGREKIRQVDITKELFKDLLPHDDRGVCDAIHLRSPLPGRVSGREEGILRSLDFDLAGGTSGELVHGAQILTLRKHGTGWVGRTSALASWSPMHQSFHDVSWL